MCGADLTVDLKTLKAPGSPPRVRSRRYVDGHYTTTTRITSACAEQTTILCGRLSAYWDHLRVCGADRGVPPSTFTRLGSPPRVRSRHLYRQAAWHRPRITSACAEQTCVTGQDCAGCRDHLRVCGADPDPLKYGDPVPGSPPRVRSRHDWCYGAGARVGITSACAEQTVFIIEDDGLHRDHLRVCGADVTSGTDGLLVRGSPPRVRSRLPLSQGRSCGRRITSACAEQTDGTQAMTLTSRDHLRVCGADSPSTSMTRPVQGSPPRVRSRPLCGLMAKNITGITSACAEQTYTLMTS